MRYNKNRYFNMNKKSLFEGTGLKATANRRQVLEVLGKSRAPLAAREVWRRVPSAKTGIASVYRALAVLCEQGLARKILSCDRALYERAQADNSPQLICSRCGKVEEVTDPGLLKYNASIMKEKKLGARHSLMLYADCRRDECGGK